MTTKPNIIIFNPDQWRGDFLSHMGDPAAVTPNLDRFATEDGISFRNAFCQNPVCTPSRCSFMSGWYPHVRGHRTMRHMLHSEHGEPVLLKDLKDNGYFVWWGGKNDLVPGQDGAERFCDVKYAAAPEDLKRWGRVAYNHNEARPDWRGEPGDPTYYNFHFGKIESETPICDGDWANVLGAVDFIEAGGSDNPFCIYLALGFPHPEFRVEDPFFSMIDRSAVPPPVSPPAEDEFEPSMRGFVRDRMNLGAMSADDWRELRAVYYGMCARVDHQFGLVCDALKRAGLYDSTVILFLSDHGEYAGDYGLVEKAQNTFEDCLTRVPLLVKPTAATPVTPGVREAFVELVDFTATVYDLAEIEPAHTHFGRSLRPFLTEECEGFREAVFCEGGRLLSERHCTEVANNPNLDPRSLYWPRQSAQASTGVEHGKAVMCRTKRFKLVKRLYEKDQLFDLESDPAELHDVHEDTAYADILRELENRLLTWYIETCDTVPFHIDDREFR